MDILSTRQEKKIKMEIWTFAKNGLNMELGLTIEGHLGEGPAQLLEGIVVDVWRGPKGTLMHIVLNDR